MVIRIPQHENTEAHGNMVEALALIVEQRDRAREQGQRAGNLEDAHAWLSISSGLTAALLTLRAESPRE